MTTKLLMSDKLFDLPDQLLRDLHLLRARRGVADPIEHEHDAFLLDPGLGPAIFLTTEGRLLWVVDFWDVLPTRAEAILAIHAGIVKTKIAGLRELLPKEPSDSAGCSDCEGTGRFSACGRLIDTAGRPFSLICSACAGLGWTAPSLDLTLLTPWAG